MGIWGHTCLLLAVEIVKWSLVLSSSESVLFLYDGKEHGLSEDVLVVGDEGSWGNVCCFGFCQYGTVQGHKVCENLI